MNILADARTVRPGRTGVGYYTEAMTRALGVRAAGRHSVSALTLTPGEWNPPPPGVALCRTRIDYESHPVGELYENLVLPARMRREKVDVFWGAAFLIPWVPTRAVRVATIHDLTAITHPQCYRRRFAAYMRLVLHQTVRHADALVVISEFVARQVREHFPDHAPACIIPAAADPFFSPSAERLAGLEPYLLAIGAGDPRKDTGLLLRLYDRMRRTAGERVPELRIVGDWREPLPEGVRVLPRQSRDALRELYRGATLFLFPTAGEGFGLPVLEAMQCGCPVAASATGAVPEVADDAAFLFDHSDEELVAGALLDLLNSPEQLAHMRVAGLRRASRFSWERSADQLLQLFENTAERKRRK